jgi:chemotaxis protein CheX
MQIPDEIIAHLVSATHDVFETMVFKSVHRLPDVTEVPAQGAHVVATVAFAGYRCGAVSFHSATEVAQQIAGAMLGIPPESVNGEMPDAIGEIANMLAGTLRTRMAAIEPPWAIAVPTVTVGTNFRTRYIADVARAICCFAMDEQPIFVELILNHGKQGN